MELTLTTLIIMGIAGLYLWVRMSAGRKRIYLPDALVLSTGSHTVGAAMIFAQRDTVATSFILSAALLSFASTAFFTIMALAISRPTNPALPASFLRNSQSYRLALVGVVAANILIVGLIFSNPAIFSLIIASLTINDDSTLLSVRKAITASTEGYMPAGLIKVVRDIIGPIVIVSFILSHQKAGRSRLMWVALIASMTSIMIGGQRFPMLMLLTAVNLAFLGRQAIEGRRVRFGPRRFALLTAVGMFFFYIMSSLLGRNQDNVSGIEAVLWSVTSLIDRVFTTVPHEAEKTFGFWSQIGPTWGFSWMADLAILLPGKNESFSSVLHELGGGSAEGNAPLFFAADAWLAFGFGGIVFVSFLFVAVLHSIDSVLWNFRSPRNDAARIVLFLCVPLMYSPFLFMLYGGIVVLPICAWTVLTRGFAVTHRIRRV